MDVNLFHGGSAGARLVDGTRNYQMDMGNMTVTETAQPTNKPKTAENEKDEDKQQGWTDEELEKRLENAVTQANDKVKHTGLRQCEFAYNKEAKRISIKVYDARTKEVIREIPPEKTLEMIERLFDLEGIMVDEKR
jgi:flagellar protein FlaG